MAEAWPSSLPDKVAERNFQVQKGSSKIRSSMDVGSDKIRRRYTKSIDQFSVGMFMTGSEFTTFETYYDTTLNGGVKTFLFNDPVSQVEKEFRFKGDYSYTSLGAGNYFVSMVWEKLP